MAVNAVSMNAENVDRAIEEVKHAEAALTELRKKLTEKKKEAAAAKVAAGVDEQKVNSVVSGFYSLGVRAKAIPLNNLNGAGEKPIMDDVERLLASASLDEVKAAMKKIAPERPGVFASKSDVRRWIEGRFFGGQKAYRANIV